jgi:hypothetical protein
VTFEFVFALLVVYQLKHFLADYPLQGQYMLRKFSPDWKVWIPALSAHAGVHAVFTFIIFQWVQGFYSNGVDTLFSVACAAIDFSIHFCMDRIKASPNMMGRWKSLSAKEFLYYKSCVGQPGEHPNVPYQVNKILRGNTYFWWALGFDQMVHHLTHYYLVYVLVIFLVRHGQ